jgi:hypothetical protein
MPIAGSMHDSAASSGDRAGPFASHRSCCSQPLQEPRLHEHEELATRRSGNVHNVHVAGELLETGLAQHPASAVRSHTWVTVALMPQVTGSRAAGMAVQAAKV